MTTPSPKVVHTVTNVWFDASSTPIPNVKSLIASADLDRVPYATATIVLGPVDDSAWAALDPRNGVEIRWQSVQYDLEGNELGRLPYDDTFQDEAIMWLRTATRDHITGEVTLELAGGETMLQDKKRIAGTTLNTGATSVDELVLYSLYDVFGSAFYTPDPAGITAIPAGDRRLMVQGESHLELLQPELDAINYRLMDSWGRRWTSFNRSTAYGTPLKLATYETDAPADADPCVTELREVATRDGDWADGVLVEYSPPGSSASTWQASGTGANTRGIVLRRERTAPGSNAANQIVNRSKARGYELEVTARLRYDGIAFAGVSTPRPQTLTVYTPDRTLSGRIRAIEWDTEAGTMTIRAQTGDPIT